MSGVIPRPEGSDQILFSEKKKKNEERNIPSGKLIPCYLFRQSNPAVFQNKNPKQPILAICPSLKSCMAFCVFSFWKLE